MCIILCLQFLPSVYIDFFSLFFKQNNIISWTADASRHAWVCPPTSIQQKHISSVFTL